MNTINLVFLSVLFSLSSLAMEQFPNIIEAAKNHDLNAVQQMIAHGANVNQQDKYGVTALMYVAYNNNPDIMECLLNAGANVNQQDVMGGTALMTALVYRNDSIFERLLQVGAKVNQQIENGKSLLMVAARKARDEHVVQRLVQAGANVNHLDKHGWSALMCAAQRSKKKGPLVGAKIVQCLLHAGARVNHCTQSGFNALMIAAQRKNKMCYEPLIDALMRIPNKNQRNRIVSFLLSIKYMLGEGVPRKDIFSLIKPHLLNIVMQENRESPGTSFVWNMISDLKSYSFDGGCGFHFEPAREKTRKKLYIKVIEKCPLGTRVDVRNEETRSVTSFFKEQNEVNVCYSEY